MIKIKQNPNNKELAIKINEMIDYFKKQRHPLIRVSLRDLDGFIDPVTDK